MIDFGSQVIILDGEPDPIVKWEVWFLVTTGFVKTMLEVKAEAERLEMPIEFIRPVPVAIGQRFYEPVLHK